MTIAKLDKTALDVLDNTIDVTIMSNYYFKLSKHLIDVMVLKDNIGNIMGSACIDYNTGDTRTKENKRVFFYDIFLADTYASLNNAKQFMISLINMLKQEGYTEFTIGDEPELEDLREALSFTYCEEGYYVKKD